MAQDELYDVIIIGAAAAGCAAAIYAARRNLKFIVVSKDIGGEVALSGEVENWPGIEKTTGFELARQFHKHALGYGVEFHDGFGVESIAQEQNHHVVRVKNAVGEERSYKTKTVIIGSGIHPRELDIPGEKNLKNKGVTYCTVCDGPLFKGKPTATIGAGNSALESALMMGGIASTCYLITKYPKSERDGFPKGEDILIQKVKKLKNVKIIYNASTTEIHGSNAVESITYADRNTKEEKRIDVSGVMVHIGMIPNSSFVDCVEKNNQGEIKVNVRCETSCPGIFAAGDVTDIPFKQIAIAAGQGVTAALSSIDYLNKWSE